MKKIILLALAMAVLFGMAAGEKVPLLMSYQALIRDAAGIPLNGTYDIKIRFYDAPTGGTMLYHEDHDGERIIGGEWTSEPKNQHPDFLWLPVSFPTSPNDSGDYDIWMEIQIGTDAPISPRTHIVSSPFSMMSRRVAGDFYSTPGHVSIFPAPDPVSDCAYVPLRLGVDASVAQIDMRPPNPPVNDCTAYVPIQLKVSDNIATIRLKNPSTVSDCAYVPMSMSVDASLAQIRMRPPTPVSDCAYVPLRMFSSASESNISLLPPHPNMGGSLELSTGAAGSGPSLMIVDPGPPNREVGEQMQIAMVQKDPGPVQNNMLTLNATPSSGASMVMLNPQPLPPNGANPWLSLSTDMNTGASMEMNDGIVNPGPPQTTFHLTGGMAGSGSELDMYGTINPGPPQLQFKGGNSSEGASLVMRHTSAAGSTDDIVMNSNSNGGKIGINTPSPAEALHVVGNICATGTIGACSDERYKKNIETITNALELISKIRGVNFKWRTSEFPDQKFSDEEQVGFIAQEINKVLPEVVSLGSDGYYSVDYARLTPVLLQAMKEQQITIESMSQRLERLEKSVKRLASADAENKVGVAVSEQNK